MGKIKLVAIDLAKRSYQLGAFDVHGKLMSNRKLSRVKFALAIQQLEPTIVAMEACAAAHYWGRRLQALGHEVRLVPPQHARAFRRVHKSDAHDVVSIAEAAQRPNIHFVPLKSIAQQDLQVLGRMRERVVAQRTALINQARGFAGEYGVSFPQGRELVLAALPRALEDASNELSALAREALAQLLSQIRQLDLQLKHLRRRLHELASLDPAYTRLMSVPGIGRTLAPALLARMGHAQQFATARCCSAWVGLVPRQYSTGGREQLGAITKNGDKHLRVMLIHGARAVVRYAHRYDHVQSHWINGLIARRGKNKAIVALANKLMRIVWAVLTRGVSFDMRKAFRAQAC